MNLGAAALFTAGLTLTGTGGNGLPTPTSAPLPAPPPPAISDIPPAYQLAYQQAATVCPGLPWTLLAGIGKVETNHGRERGTAVFSGENSAGAAGPMQFLQGTWDDLARAYPDMAGGSRYDITTAARGTAHYLCENNVVTRPAAAIHAYNPWNKYVQRVLQRYQEYRAAEEQALVPPK